MHLSFQEHHLFQILKRYDLQHLPLDLFLSHYFKAHRALGSKDRKLISEAIYGMIRWQKLLDFLVGKQNSWESRYAIYKNFQPENYLLATQIPLHVRISFPQDLFELLTSQYGVEKATRLCQICNTPAPTTIRVNTLKITREELLNRWKSQYDVLPCEFSPQGILFKKRIPFFELEEFKKGFFEVQDEGSQLLANLVQPTPGDQILDFCAGSGGKTLAFAPYMHGKGQIYLHDIRETALEQAKRRLSRAGIQNAQLLYPEHKTLEKLKRKMDWVLVDAPCSGSGTLRRNPDMKWKFSVEMLEGLAGQQRTIFEKALSFVKPGGKIIYGTCSILNIENELQVDHFIKTYSLKMIGSPFVSLPTFGGMDGFFGAVFEKPS